MNRLFVLVACSTMVMGAVGCGSSADTATVVSTEAHTTVADTGAEPELTGSLTIMAPGPFKMLLEQATAEFELAHPDVTITLNLGHVPTLLTQLDGGVAADVLITPDSTTMGQATTRGLTATDPVVFARVPMALVVPAGNAAGVSDVTALGDSALRVAVCAAELPCGGELVDELAANASVTISADTLEPGGSPGVVTKASTGEIDVGLVFTTDIAAGGDKVLKIAIPDDINVTSDASTAVLTASTNVDVAAAFVAFLASTAGTELATGLGFQTP